MTAKSQVIAHGAGGSTHTGEAATRRFQLLTVRSGLKLEAAGIKVKRGVSMIKVAQALTGLKNRDRDTLINKLTLMVRELEAGIEFVPPPQALAPDNQEKLAQYLGYLAFRWADESEHEEWATYEGALEQWLTREGVEATSVKLTRRPFRATLTIGDVLYRFTVSGRKITVEQGVRAS